MARAIQRFQFDVHGGAELLGHLTMGQRREHRWVGKNPWSFGKHCKNPWLFLTIIQFVSGHAD
jgi:hypothetical protein